jgi:hypothetical protein
VRWPAPAPGEDEDAWAAREWKRITEAPLLRTFPFLGGWGVVFMPMDVFEYRGMARMFIGTFFGFKPDELIPLQARRHLPDQPPERTFWAIAVEPSAMRRWQRRAARSRLKARRDARGEQG